MRLAAGRALRRRGASGGGLVALRGLRTGVVGAGNMGRGVAWSLARAGHEVFVYDVDASAAAACAGAERSGLVRVAATLEEAVAEDAVLVSVSNEAAERAVFEGVVAACRSRAEAPVVLNLGTTSVAFARELHEAWGAMPFLDAPVSGGPEGAKQGTLAVMCGGADASFARAADVLDAIGSRSVLLGGAGAGAGAKLVNQLLAAANAQSAGEALALADALGCDLAKLLPLLEVAWAQSTMLSRSGAIVAACGDVQGLKMEASAAPLRNFAKDLDLVLAAAEAAKLRLPSAAVARASVARATAGGFADADWAAVAGCVSEIRKSDLEATSARLWADGCESADAAREKISTFVERGPPLCVVDDDPTGTQTVHDVFVSSTWSEADMRREVAEEK